MKIAIEEFPYTEVTLVKIKQFDPTITSCYYIARGGKYFDFKYTKKDLGYMIVYYSNLITPENIIKSKAIQAQYI